MMDYERTGQQVAILNYPYRLGQVILNPAYAGTGKTTNLVDLCDMFAQRFPHWNGLYLCYNKANQIEAKSRFTAGNVEPRTTHSLAWYPYGKKYAHKLGNPRLRDIRNVMPSEIRRLSESWEACSAAYEATKEYMYSEDKEPSAKCFSGRTKQRFGNAWPGLSLDDRDAALTGLVKHLWMLMCKEEDLDCDEPNLAMPHDGYLKHMQLAKPSLNYDFILFDECQDANPATLSIVLRQKNALKVFVGDEHQQIYAFRGSKNAMKILKPDAVMELSHSFRFGQEIADFGNECLNRLKELKKPVKIVGAGKPGTVNSYSGRFVAELGARTIISRTNATIIENAWTCVQECIPFTIVGGADSTALKQAASAYHLWQHDKYNVEDPFMKSFQNWTEFCGYAKASQDNEALRMMGLVNEYGMQLPKIITSIKQKCLAQIGLGNDVVTFTTAHKSKGMQWPRVYLADDFMREDWYDGPELKKVPEAEANLLYVAVTRAELELNLPSDIYVALTITEEEVQEWWNERRSRKIHPNSDLSDVNDRLDDLFDREVNLHTSILGSILKIP